MSKEDFKTLNTMTLIGNVDKRNSNAWHYRADFQGDEPNHYPGFIPVEDVIRRLFNWEAVEAPVYVKSITTGEFIEQNDRKAIVRSDNGDVLGMFKSSYAIHQYKHWFIDNVANIVDDSQLGVDSAGCLRNGGIGWVTISMPDNVTTSAGLDVRPYLLATTSHNGTIATTYKRVYNVPVCDNTLFAGLNEDGRQYKVRHTTNSTARIQSIRDALDIVFVMTQDIVSEIERLGSITVTDRQWEEIVNILVPIAEQGKAPQSGITRATNKQGIIRDMYVNDPMVAPWKGSALGVLQAFNTFNHHHRTRQSKTSLAEKNMLNTLMGTFETADNQVLEAINAVVLV